ncbi:hypothetical protein A9Q86_00385 [Flavobacteriales bacterium 33_180_T64]|nr:hypothetical protein A9Q86_00385 [Flavobacteriales bacterium 33_180_T64]
MNKIYTILILFCISTQGYTQDLIPFRAKDKWGFANTEGKIIINTVYDTVSVYEPNKLLKTRVSIVKKNGSINVIDKQNKTIFDYNLKLQNIFLLENFIIAERPDHKFILYDCVTNNFKNLIFDSFEQQRSFTLSIEIDGKIGLIDYKFNTIIPIEYDFIYYNIYYSDNRYNSELIKALSKDFKIDIKDSDIFVNDEKLDNNNDLIVATVINEEESKKIIVQITLPEYDFSYSEVDEDIEIESLDVIESTEKQNELDSTYNFIDCNKNSEICIFSKNGKKGIYNFKTKKASQLYTYVNNLLDFKVFEVRNNDNTGVVDSDLNQVMPMIYQDIVIDYKSNYILFASKRSGDTYDFYNLKTKKYIYKDSEYKKGQYLYKSSSKGKYFFAVEKKGLFYYVNEDGLEYYTPN